MNTWPNDILLIQYPDLGSTPDERLRVLSAIGVLLNKPVSSYLPPMLGLLLDDWDLLRAWIEQGHGKQFWHLESQGIRITRICEKHVLIGTSLLLGDLRSLVETRSLSRFSKLDEVWMLARRYAMSEIISVAD